MKWVKKGLIFKPDNNYDWMVSHASVPIADKVSNDRLRIYLGPRDADNRTRITFIEIDSYDPKKVLYVHDRPVLDLGKLGCFDDSGVMPSWIVNFEGRKYLYYIGWNQGTTVPYRNSIGLAVSDDGGVTFHRVCEGPVVDRKCSEPHFAGSSCVIIENGTWKMWYLSTVEWKIHNDRPEPYYHIKYAESDDGIHWDRDGLVCIDFKSPAEGGISRPCVIKENELYRMWYSYRGGKNYRVDKSQSYRIGYAESENGIRWTRQDDSAGIDVSETGWDSEMIEYPYVFECNDQKLMLYNGNGFGESGLGYAILEE